MKTHSTIRLAALILALTAVATTRATAQEVARVEVGPATLSLEVGETATVSATAYDAAGNVVDIPFLYFSRDGRGSLAVNRTTGAIEAFKGGEYTVLARALGPGRISGAMTVTVAFPPLDRIDISEDGGRYYAGVTVRHKANVIDQADDARDVPVTWSTSDESMGTVDRFGVFTAHAPGEVTLSATAEGVVGRITYQVADNPVTRVAVEASQTRGRTGDVVHFAATATDAGGGAVDAALIGVAFLLPGVVLGMYGGAVADALPKRAALAGAPRPRYFNSIT